MLDTDCICADEPVAEPPAVQKPSPPTVAEDEKTAPLDETFDSLASSGVMAARNVSIAISAADAGSNGSSSNIGSNKMISFADDVTNFSAKSSEEKKDGDEFSPEEDPHTAISVLETDYDVKPTDLYSLVEKRQWDHALNLLYNLAHYAALTQASTWVVRKEPETGKLRWRLLPLHAAIIFRGPLPVIEALVRAYPGAGRCRDDQGMTPAHLAFRNDAPDEILDEVLNAYPAAIAIKDRKGREPLTCAMGSNCTKKTRAKLLASYSSIAMAGERAKVLLESSTKHEADIVSLQDQYESSLQDKLAQIATLEEQAARVPTLVQELEDSAARETVLTEKVQDLTKALEAMTAMRQVEAKKHTDEASQWSAVSKDVLQTLGKGTDAADAVERSVAEKEEEAGEDGKDVLRSSIDDLVTSHRRLQAERDELAERNDVLESLLERTVAERDGVEAILGKLDQDMAAAQTVRERMIAAIAKQEAEVYGLAAREHDVMRGILERQRSEMEAALLGESAAYEEDQDALRRSYSANSLNRGRGRSDMSELGLGGAEEGRTPPRSPGHARSKSPYNRAATAGY
mmetsp:Transcript_10362/g.29141  ORF Transcript_10362/g.29141 Transcript_10362/m.29141 type:complete len:573 (-) Transcript_10362:310-2028(-)